MNTRTTHLDHTSRRGGAAVYVLGGLVVAASAVALTVDFGALKRGLMEKDLAQQVEAFQTARLAEDTAGLQSLFATSATADFDTLHLAELWAFDTTDVARFEGLATKIDWATRTATVTGTAFVVADGGEPVGHELSWRWAHTKERWGLVPAEEPWGRSLGDVLHAERQAQLVERAKDYIELRLTDDQEALYAMLREADRAKSSLAEYLAVFGQGVLKVHGIELTDTRVATDGRSATVDMLVDCELVVSNLPPEMRRNFSTAGTNTRAQSPYRVAWEYENGDWYFTQEEKPVREQETYAKGNPSPSGAAPLPAGAAGPTLPAPNGKAQ
jgi:hypothetical protein